MNTYRTNRPIASYHDIGDQIGMTLTSVVARVVTRYCPLRDDVHYQGEGGINEVAAGFSNQSYAGVLGEVSVQSWCHVVADLCIKVIIC